MRTFTCVAEYPLVTFLTDRITFDIFARACSCYPLAVVWCRGCFVVVVVGGGEAAEVMRRSVGGEAKKVKVYVCVALVRSSAVVRGGVKMRCRW